MNAPTNVNVIKDKAGLPAFVVIPYSDYLELTGKDPEEVLIPNEVIGIMVNEETSLLGAWRRHLGFTQAQIGERLGISQSSVRQTERHNSKPQRRTLEKWSQVLGVPVDALTLDD